MRIFIGLILTMLCSCSGLAPMREFTQQEKDILFIKDHVPTEKECAYLGKVEFRRNDNPGGDVGCALQNRQGHVFVTKAAQKGANLVVANFSKNSNGVHSTPTETVSCANDAKIFKCSSSALETLKRFE